MSKEPMTNEEKIALIKHYLIQRNCAGVEVEWEDCKWQGVYKATLSAVGEHTFDKHTRIIGDPKPIAIELEPLKSGDRVWVEGETGYIKSFVGGGYSVHSHQKTYLLGIFHRHELIKVMK